MSLKLHGIFQQARKNKRALFLPYVCVGYPTFQSSLKTAEGALRAGAAALELGMPFSDPIADGPTLQAATHFALSHGTRFSHVFRMIRELRSKKFDQPLLVMTYLNMVEQMGHEKFLSELKNSGGDGAIIPDLPLEEFGGLSRAMKLKDLSLIPFVAPTSSPDRVKKADSQGAPFLYYVSVTGVTGARKVLSPGLLAALVKLRKRLKTPLVVGFGISTPAQAAQVGKAADGVIIASALIQLISKAKLSAIGEKAERFCRQVVQRMKTVRN